MIKVKDQVERGRSLAKGRENHYYIKKYKDLTVADLLLVLEDDNWHNAETLLECLAHQNYSGLLKTCEVMLQHDKEGSMSEKLYEEIREIDAQNRGEG